MKNRIVSVMLIFAFVLSIIACKKSFFEATTNDGSINDGTGYKTKESFDAGVAGAYVNLQSAVEPLITLPAYISKDIEPGGAPTPYDVFFSSGYTFSAQQWRELYKIINNANIVIEKLEGVAPGILTDEEKKKAMGQVKFLRGFAYLHLTQAFGDIPMPLESYSDALNSISCTPQAGVITQVISDLTEAAANLPEAMEWGSADLGRVGKGAALGYLVLANMYKLDWPAAAAAAERLFALTKPKYELKADVRQEFSALNRNLSSSVFEIQFNPKSGNKWVGWGGSGSPDNGHIMATQTSPPGVGDRWTSFGGWGSLAITPTVLNRFEPGDDRRKKLLIKYPEPYKGELMTDSFNAQHWPTDPDFLNRRTDFGYSTKYWYGPSPLPAGENIVMMRFAEVLLNYAEIQFNRGQHADAYAQLNKIRERAKLPPRPVSTNKETFMTDLMNERRLETLMEPGFWYHLTRTGRAANFLKDNYNITMLPQWKHTPIPSTERDINPNLCSNGY